MILICWFRRSLATAQTNRFALRLARDSAQRGRLCRSRAFTPMGLWSYYFWEAHLSGAESVGYAFLSGIRFRCGQHKQSQPRQAKQQAGKNHKNDPHSLETKALSNGRNQKHGSQENGDAQYSSPVSPDFVPRSAISAACL